MWNTTISRRLAGPLLVAAVSSLLLPQASPAASIERRCRAAIESGLTRWAKGTVRARLKCQADIFSGFENPAIDCRTGNGSRKLTRKLDAAMNDLRRRLESACDGVHWGLLSYPGPCGEEGSEFGVETLSQCIQTIGDETFGRLFDVWYPDVVDYVRGPAAECGRTIPKRASSMVLRELKARLRCLLDGERAGDATTVDCRAQLPPYGPGTASDEVDRRVLRAQAAWLGGMPRACSIADFSHLGYGAECPFPLDLGAGLLQFQSCVFRTNRLQVPLLLDLAFPSDAVCGNGILQEGEICDDGAGNSDTVGDACRLDCTLPFCGDGTRDPGAGEECDDGDDEDLDGCTPDCVREFCGDGIVNNLPAEACDDGNQNANDRCTGTCQVATCGDGVVCNAPSCTSGPGGGPELCDLGAANAPGGKCDTTCYGFTRDCTLTVGVTNNVRVGALTYELSYAGADGQFVGTGGAVSCTSLVTGGLVSFFDNEATRAVKESLIVDAGFQAPKDIARCSYVSNDPALAAGDFGFVINAAADPNFQPVSVTLAVTSLACTP